MTDHAKTKTATPSSDFNDDERQAGVTDELQRARELMGQQARKTFAAKRALTKAERQVWANTLVLIDGQYLICPPLAAELCRQLDTRVDFTSDRYLRGYPCSDVEELIGRMVVARNRALRSKVECDMLRDVARVALAQIAEIKSRWPREPMARWCRPKDAPKRAIKVSQETLLPVNRVELDRGLSDDSSAFDDEGMAQQADAECNASADAEPGESAARAVQGKRGRKRRLTEKRRGAGQREE